MSTKIADQHIPLHAVWGADDCCLCKALRERDEDREKLRALWAERDALKADMARVNAERDALLARAEKAEAALRGEGA